MFVQTSSICLAPLSLAATYERAPAPKLADMADDSDPISLFQAWFAEAKTRESADPTAMALASADASGVVRTNTSAGSGAISVLPQHTVMKGDAYPLHAT